MASLVPPAQSSASDPLPSTTFDSIVIGGGPAGLSAAVYLGRSLRSVVVLDGPRPGRSDWVQCNHNYLGFPEGITAPELSARGREQAKRFGATFVEERVIALSR